MSEGEEGHLFCNIIGLFFVDNRCKPIEQIGFGVDLFSRVINGIAEYAISPVVVPFCLHDLHSEAYAKLGVIVITKTF